ncbi:MAG: hypothetical protein QXE05_00430 [Nitrososphaeria archaeon]
MSQANSIIAELHPNDLTKTKLKKLLQTLRNARFNFAILRPQPHEIPLEETLKRNIGTTDLGHLQKVCLFLKRFFHIYVLIGLDCYMQQDDFNIIV